MRTVIIDDPSGRKSFEETCASVGDIELTGGFESLEEALEFMKTNPVDWLCINAPHEEHERIVKIISGKHPQTAVSFVLSYSEYVMEYGSANADTYLVRPYTREFFERVIRHIKTVSSSYHGMARGVFDALCNAYDCIVEADLIGRMADCLYYRAEEKYKDAPVMRMDLDSAIKYYAETYIWEEDRTAFAGFVNEISESALFTAENNGMDGRKAEFGAELRDGSVRNAECLVTGIGEGKVLICCRMTDKVKREARRMPAERKDVYIRTFGYFEVRVDGEPIPFRFEKAKELLAILVDRRGSYVDYKYAINCLWENEPANKTVQSRYRQTAMRLNNLLKEHGIDYIVETVNGKRRILTDMIHCDLYDYLKSKGSLDREDYLPDYGWSR